MCWRISVFYIFRSWLDINSVTFRLYSCGNGQIYALFCWSFVRFWPKIARFYFVPKQYHTGYCLFYATSLNSGKWWNSKYGQAVKVFCYFIGNSFDARIREKGAFSTSGFTCKIYYTVILSLNRRGTYVHWINFKLSCPLNEHAQAYKHPYNHTH